MRAQQDMKVCKACNGSGHSSDFELQFRFTQRRAKPVRCADCNGWGRFKVLAENRVVEKERV